MCGGGGLDSYTNLHEGDGNGTTAYGIRLTCVPWNNILYNNAFNAITSDVAIFTDIKSFSYHMLNDSQKPNAIYAIRQQQKITK